MIIKKIENLSLFYVYTLNLFSNSLFQK